MGSQTVSDRAAEFDDSQVRVADYAPLSGRSWDLVGTGLACFLSVSNAMKATVGLQQLSPPHAATSAAHGESKIIEFIGVTSSGKSTLLTAACDELRRQGILAEEQYDAILRACGLSFVRGMRLRSFLIDLLALPAFLIALCRPGRLRFFLRAFRIVDRDADSLLARAGLLRSVVKRIGVDAILRWLQAHGRLTGYVLCDEGSVHMAHNLFVHVDSVAENAEIEQFARAVPKPDLLVWVTTDADDAVESTLRRGHSRVPRRPGAARRFVEHGHRMFELLCAAPTVERNLLAVRNTLSPVEGNAFRDRVDEIVTFIKTSHWRTP